MSLSVTVSDIIAVFWSKIATPFVFGAPVGGEAVRFTQRPLVTKN